MNSEFKDALGLSDDESEIMDRHLAELRRAKEKEIAARPTPDTISVWSEGYACSGQRSGAQLLGRVIAPDFNNAVLKIMAQMEDRHSRECFSFRGGHWSHWGCRLFDNEYCARQSFG